MDNQIEGKYNMILVTGASGFVGMYTVQALLRKGYDVFATAKSKEAEEIYKRLNIPFARVDLSKEEDMKKLPKNVSAILHIGGLLSIFKDKPQKYLEVNTLGTLNLLEYAKDNDIKTFVFTHTHSDVNRAGVIDITEETPIKFAGKETFTYIVSKINAINYINAYAQEYGIRGVVLRLPGIRGWGSQTIAKWEGGEQKFVFNTFIEKAMEAQDIEIWGKCETKRDLIYIKNVVHGIVQAMESPNANGLYNLGSGEGLTIEDEAKAIINAFTLRNQKSNLIYKRDIEEVRRTSYIFKIDKAKKDFDFTPKYTLEEAMLDMKKDMDLVGKQTPWDKWSVEDISKLDF